MNLLNLFINVIVTMLPWDHPTWSSFKKFTSASGTWEKVKTTFLEWALEFNASEKKEDKLVLLTQHEPSTRNFVDNMGLVNAFTDIAERYDCKVYLKCRRIKRILYVLCLFVCGSDQGMSIVIISLQMILILSL